MPLLVAIGAGLIWIGYAWWYAGTPEGSSGDVSNGLIPFFVKILFSPVIALVAGLIAWGLLKLFGHG